MDKVIRDGLVAVLVSPGYGAGWSTWGGGDVALFSPAVVAWVEGGKVGNIDQIIKSAGFPEHFYTGGAGQLSIEWLPVGTAFRIDEYDGSETLHTAGLQQWSIA